MKTYTINLDAFYDHVELLNSNKIHPHSEDVLLDSPLMYYIGYNLVHKTWEILYNILN